MRRPLCILASFVTCFCGIAAAQSPDQSQDEMLLTAAASAPAVPARAASAPPAIIEEAGSLQITRIARPPEIDASIDAEPYRAPNESSSSAISPSAGAPGGSAANGGARLNIVFQTFYNRM